MFENLRRGRQARNLTTNVPKILDVKSSSEQIFSENCRWVPLIWKPLSSDRSNNNCWDRTFSISAIVVAVVVVVAAIAGEWWLWSLRSLNFLGSEFPHPGYVTPFHDIVFIVSAVALIINNRPEKRWRSDCKQTWGFHSPTRIYASKWRVFSECFQCSMFFLSNHSDRSDHMETRL